LFASSNSAEAIVTDDCPLFMIVTELVIEELVAFGTMSRFRVQSRADKEGSETRTIDVTHRRMSLNKVRHLLRLLDAVP